MAAAVETITTTCHRLVQCITATIGIKTVEISTCQTCNHSESIQMARMDHLIKVVMSKTTQLFLQCNHLIIFFFFLFSFYRYEYEPIANITSNSSGTQSMGSNWEYESKSKSRSGKKQLFN